MSKFLNIKRPLCVKAIVFVPTEEMLCVCCLTKKGPFINLIDCKHADFLRLFFKYQTERGKKVACHLCHSMLKKIDLFKQQVEDSVLILSHQASKNYKVHLAQNLHINETKIIVNISPEDKGSNIKDEKDPIEGAIDYNSIDTTTEAKIVEVMLNKFPIDHADYIKVENNGSPMDGNVMLNENSSFDDNVLMNGDSYLVDNMPLNEVSDLDDNLRLNEVSDLDDNLRLNEVSDLDDNLRLNEVSDLDDHLRLNEVSDLDGIVPLNEVSDLADNMPLNEVPDLADNVPLNEVSDLDDHVPLNEVSDLDDHVPLNEVSDLDDTVPLNEVSDLGDTVPLNKTATDSKNKVYYVKLKPIKKVIINPSPILDEKYLGKLKILRLTREELEKGREDSRKDERYIKLPYKCEDCIVGFNRDIYLNRHIKERHAKHIGSFVCDVCKSVFDAELALKSHRRRHFIRYECERCGKRYIDERAIVSHYNENHGLEGATVKNKFKCKLPDCCYETHSYKKFLYHRTMHNSFPCNLCDKVYTKWSQLRAHIYGHRRALTPTTYKCDKCDKVYKQRCGLSSHIESAHNTTGRLQYCAPCKMQFKTKNSLQQHLRHHANHVTEADKKFMCDNCGTRFLKKTDLRSHIRWVHLKISDYQCPQCMKILKTARSLRNHIDFVHEKKQLPRNKICDYCGKAFTMNNYLLAHIRTHTGERPYECTKCGATFAHSAALYTHNRLLHNPNREPTKIRKRKIQEI